MTSPVTMATHAAIAPVTTSGRAASGRSSGGAAGSRGRAPGGRERSHAPILATVQAGAAEARRGAPADAGQRLRMTSRTSWAVPLGVRPTRTPTFSSASFFAWAVPEEPDTMAPAWPMVLPSGAVNPAT